MLYTDRRNTVIIIEDLIWHLESLNEDLEDKGLEVTIDFLRYMRRNIAGRGTLSGFLSADEYREIKI
tara:strand:- start:778 stop:978 length:201 start_codon:yes stop_codon:yes gene_type:complete